MTSERAAERPEQLELFTATHVHRFEKWRGPHLEWQPVTLHQPRNDEVFRFLATEDRWCYGCGSWIRFVEGVEIK